MAVIDSWRGAANILGVRLDALGDLLMTTPALRALKESLPGCRITMLVSPSGARAAELIPEIDETIVYEAPWMKATSPRASSQPDFRMIERLRAGGFDAAVIFTVYSQNPLPAALFCYLAGIPRRLAHCHENPYQLLTDWIADPEPQQFIRHEAQRQLDLVGQVGCQASDLRLSIRVGEAARKSVAALLAELGIDTERPLVVVHPGATAPSRRYPPESFAQVAAALAAECDCQLLFTGSQAERPLVDSIRSALPAGAPSLAGQLELEELAALLARASLLLSNNTGPVHVAAALGTPVVDLYALTNPQHTPWQTPHRVLFHDVPCKYCYKSICPEGHHDCLRRVTPEQVVEAARQLLEETCGARPSGRETVGPAC